MMCPPDPADLSPAAHVLLGDLTDWEQELDLQVAECLRQLPLWARDIVEHHGKCVSDRMAAESLRRRDLAEAARDLSASEPTFGPSFAEMQERRYGTEL